MMRTYPTGSARNSVAAHSTWHVLPLALLWGPFSCADISAGDVSWEAGITTVYQHADDYRASSEWTASVDLSGTVKTARGEWLVYVEASTTPESSGVSAFYPTVNGDARSVLTEDGDGGVQISEINYTFRIENERSLMLGLIDPSAWLDRSRISNDENQQFLNGSFVNNATIAFPDYTLGAVYRTPRQARRPAITVVLSGSDGITDLPDRSYQDLLDLNEDGRGVFLGAGANWRAGASSWRLGAWVRTDAHTVTDSETNQEMNYGAYTVYGWLSGKHAVSLRAGLANPDVSLAKNFFSVAYQRKFRFGQIGIAAANTSISSGIGSGNRDRAFDSEVYLQVPVLEGAGHVTPSIQYIEVPGLTVNETVPRATAIVIGIRIHYSFD